jgi:hypothetical protein
VFSRFVLVALVGWFLMAAGGLAWIARGHGVRRAVILLVAGAVIAVDLYVPGEIKSFRLNAPQVAAAIHRLPSGAMAQYPLVRGEIDGYAPLFNQPYYGHDVLNGFDDQPQEGFDAQLYDLSQPTTVEGLALLKIRYVLDIDQVLTGAMPSGPASPLLRPVASGMYGPWPATVLEVPSSTSHQDFAAVVAGAGFAAPERLGVNTWQWLTAKAGTITLLSQCARACRGHLEFSLAPLGPKRLVTFTAQNGVQLARIEARSLVPVNIPLDLTRTKSITVRVTPGPLPISRVEPGNPDPRSVSVQLFNARWAPSVARAP